MKKWIKMLLVLGLVSGGLSLNALAAKPGKGGGKAKKEAKADPAAANGEKKPNGFKGMDADKDGKVTRVEFDAVQKKQKGLEAKFALRDQDKDGSITKEEWKATQPEHKAKPAK